MISLTHGLNGARKDGFYKLGPSMKIQSPDCRGILTKFIKSVTKYLARDASYFLRMSGQTHLRQSAPAGYRFGK